MKRRKVCGLLITVIYILSFTLLYAQATSTRSSRSTTRSSSTTWREERKEEQREGAVRDFVMAVIGGMLRHPDPTIRKQAIEAISSGLAGDTGTTGSSTDRGGIRSLFSMSSTGSGSSSREGETSTGVGGAVFIPDLYVLLQDPDPEVRDIASVGLDMIFQTDTTLPRFMNDKDPLIRKYASQIFARKRLTGTENRTSSSTQDLEEVRDLLALRTMLVRLKYEDNEEVKKSIRDALDWYIRSGGDNRTSGSREWGQDMFGVDASIVLNYLNDPDPEIRKQAIKTIALRETSNDVLIKLMERLRVEKDEEVRRELQTAMDTIRQRQAYWNERGQGGGGIPGVGR